jgi:DNA-binding transcriptional MerR regulator
MRIGDLARAAATSAATIRYYEDIGLLPRPGRGAGDQRRYSPADVERLAFIRRCRALGFSLKHIQRFAVAARAGASRSSCREIMRARLADVRARLKELGAVEARLVELLEEDKTDTSPSCTRLAVLA